jgi:methylphosphotriester-DNA--protein-cysteine methyltransferase
MSALPLRARGMLSSDALKRITEYVVAHLDESIEVAALAGIATRSPFHFTRVFTQAVGLTPHRYVFDLVRNLRMGLRRRRMPLEPDGHVLRAIGLTRGISLSADVSRDRRPDRSQKRQESSRSAAVCSLRFKCSRIPQT